ncbi:tRNA lysidine(34) synthetase TilS [Undibacterium sp. LX40W]|uniref:tRNA(Ile)-lysidine synthase n=1 Tax=Undibacterium nitidum TaxID=2762298 RepID=A0A923HIT1_9BURK|nr:MULTISPECIES: tRNA lysidine(34) synthetase TilS [Undibacterium]MBC3880174.1 tRNA lysidine(34) synthetase TilS [Undibacterium nitidum]MBC3891090.1 tRNA lysidine(34) synthetase TilS [Undibacterium sp. LX40W]
MSLGLAASVDAFEHRAVAKLAGLLKDQVPLALKHGIAVAYSGGLDSTALLHLVSRFCADQQIPCFAFHVHHGLSRNADAWMQHCASECINIGVPFDFQRVQINLNGEGLEAAARRERYQALGTLCTKHQIPLLLTAHHIDDQAETLLMQLLRGSGPRGLGGMDDFNFAPDLLHSASLMVARPLLHETRKHLEVFCAHYSLSHVNDESNEDLRFTRNAIRRQLMPQLEVLAPKFSQRLARSASHMRSANRMLDELADSDLRAALDEDALQLKHLVNLSTDRIDNLFRYWLSISKVQMPSTSKLSEMRKQLFSARADARIGIQHLDFTLSRYDEKIYLIRSAPNQDPDPVVNLLWMGEGEIEIPEFNGRLSFEEAEVGISPQQLYGKSLRVQRRVSGIRLRLGKNRPSRDMKSHFQTCRIPFWRRAQLPFLFMDERLLFVAEVGIDAYFLSEEPGPKIRISWKDNP